MIRTTPVKGFIGCAAALADHDYASAVAGVKRPVAVHGRRKGRVTPAAMRKLSEKLPGSRYVELPGAGHISNMDRPAEFTQGDPGFPGHGPLTALPSLILIKTGDCNLAGTAIPPTGMRRPLCEGARWGIMAV